MRTTKRFTPRVLARFRRTGRGLGIYQNYIPWHRVGRSDPASCGRSHLQQWHDRQRELLSDGEWNELFFAVMLANLVDIREQFPLATESAMHELASYLIGHPTGEYPGTLELASHLGIKHPIVTGPGESAVWVMTTDLLLALKRADGSVELLAIAFKPASYTESKRTVALLRLEGEYWSARNVLWLLITPRQYDSRVALTLQRSMAWALDTPVTEADQSLAVAVLARHHGCSLTFLIDRLEPLFDSKDHAQRAFWQAVWSGRIPMDLRRGWRPHRPIDLVTPDEFWSFNPITSRRTAWN